jgi:DnaJ-class molecular chaperone
MARYDNSVIPGGKVKFEDPCKRCGGTGRVKHKRNEKRGDRYDNIQCPRCGGEGKRMPAPR